MELWKDYYLTKKPHCYGCEEKGMSKEEYTFCSTEKSPYPIFEEDSWSKKGKQIGVFEDIYQCNVYHWTIYQGQEKISKIHY